MWSTLDKEISSLKEHVKLPRRAPTFNDIMAGYRKVYFINGPGLLTDINHKTKDLFPSCFSGLNIILNKELNDGIRYNFNLNLDKTELEYYKPYNKYIGRELKYSSDMNRAGFSNLVFQHDFSKELKCTILGHVQHLGAAAVDCVMDYYGNNFTGSLSLCNVDISSGELAAHYLHEVNSKLAVGAEVAVQTGKSMSVEATRFNVAGSYDLENKGLFTGSIGSKGLQVCFYKKLRPHLSVGSIVDFCFETKKPTASLACQLIENEFILKCCVDSSGRAGANLSRHIYSDNTADINLTISTLTNFTNQIKFGIGIDVTM